MAVSKGARRLGRREPWPVTRSERAREWLAGREELLKREKEHTRLGDEIAQQRRDLPWVRVEKDYRFETDEGGKVARRALRRAIPAARLPLHVRPELRGRLPGSTRRSRTPSTASSLTCTPATRRCSSSHRHRSRSFRRTGAEWVGVSRGSRPRPSSFNFDLGFSQTEEQSREAVAQVSLPSQTLDGAFPPIVAHNASATGTDIAGYLTESPGFSTFVREGDDIYHAYSTTWRGLEFLMTYYPILDHAPKGRDEAEITGSSGTRRHDEYESA